MREIIMQSPNQFLYEPTIENAANFKINAVHAMHNLQKFIVVGMGGSHLAADLIKYVNPYLPIHIHRDYGLPELPYGELASSLIIAVSYSGNTEETLDAFREALKPINPALNPGRRIPHLAAVTCGGELLRLAQEHDVPYIQIPDTGIPPRSATGFLAKALLKLMRQDRTFGLMTKLADIINPSDIESAGQRVATQIKGKVPVIYSSDKNAVLAQNWKIRFNENVKIPAFYNVLPELNHNEMTGFDVCDATRTLSGTFFFLLLKDAHDHPRVQLRTQILERFYKERELNIGAIELPNLKLDISPYIDQLHIVRLHKAFYSIILADWTAYHLAKSYGIDPVSIPMVEEFKKLMATENK